MSIPKHVLIVDDSPVQLSTREAILRSAGFQVSIATTAASALALLQTVGAGDTVQVVVTDHVMPQLSGSEFVRELRATRPDLPIIVVTGMPGIESDYEGVSKLTVRQKPVAPGELISLVAAA